MRSKNEGQYRPTVIFCAIQWILALTLSVLPAVSDEPSPSDLKRQYREAFRSGEKAPRLALVRATAARGDATGTRFLLEILRRNETTLERTLYRKRAGHGRMIDRIFQRAIDGKRLLSDAENTHLQTVKAGLAVVDRQIDAIVEVRWQAAEALSKCTQPEARALFLEVARQDRNRFLRNAAARALGQAGDPDPVPTLRRNVADDDEPTVQTAALDTLGRLRAGAAFEEIASALETRHWPVRAAAAAALGAVGDLRAVRILIDRLPEETGRLRTDLDRALGRLTGFEFGGSAALWESWWKVHGPSVNDGSFVRREKTVSNGPEETGITFYGVRSLSNRIIFILDISMSMKYRAGTRFPVSGGANVIQPEGNRKIDIARAQLKTALLALPEGAEFNIIFYRQGIEVLHPKMIRRTDRNLKRAFEFIDRRRPAGGTNLFDALHRAFNPVEVLDSGTRITDRNYAALADTVYLLSDGEPNYGRLQSSARMVQEIGRLNRSRKIVVHAIGIGEHNVSFMRALAEATGGEYAAHE